MDSKSAGTQKSAVSGANANDMLKNQRVFEALVQAGSKSNKLFPEEDYSIKSGKEGEDLFKHFRGMLILGRILGVIPLSGVFSSSYRNLHFRVLSIPGITSLLCILSLAFNCVMAVWDAVSEHKRSVYKIAKSIGNPLFAFWGFFIYVYCFHRSHQFLKIFKAWARWSKNLTYTKKDIYLDRTIAGLGILMFTSTVLENAILHMQYFQYFDDINGHTVRWGKDTSNVSVVQMYYWRSHLYWDKIIGYHPIFAVLVFLVHKWILYGLNYMDIFSSLMFRALYFKFKALCESAEENLLKPMPLDTSDTYVGSKEDQQVWIQLARDHDALCQVLNVMNEFFSPILFTSYAINIYFFCMQLLFGLNPEEVQHSVVHSIYAPWSFIHIILRIFFLSFFAAKVNEYAHKVREVVMRCPVELYSGPIVKLEKLVNGGQKLGLSGLGCFVITKPFMLSLLNVVFTIEIVLLQGLSAESSGNGC